MHGSAVVMLEQCCTMLCIALPSNSVQCSAVQSSAVQCSALQGSAVQCSTVQKPLYQARDSSLIPLCLYPVQFKCKNRRFLKPLLLSSIANAGCLFSQSIPPTPSLNFESKYYHVNRPKFLYNLLCKFSLIINHVYVSKVKCFNNTL